ncbi:Hypothetical protein MVR_LOCUS231 [uncultured virus]|nr:Hypothetical protein MVR_LOCUS231 [uncultured virus]
MLHPNQITTTSLSLPKLANDTNNLTQLLLTFQLPTLPTADTQLVDTTCIFNTIAQDHLRHTPSMQDKMAAYIKSLPIATPLEHDHSNQVNHSKVSTNMLLFNDNIINTLKTSTPLVFMFTNHGMVIDRQYIKQFKFMLVHELDDISTQLTNRALDAFVNRLEQSVSQLSIKLPSSSGCLNHYNITCIDRLVSWLLELDEATVDPSQAAQVSQAASCLKHYHERVYTTPSLGYTSPVVSGWYVYLRNVVPSWHRFLIECELDDLIDRATLQRILDFDINGMSLYQLAVQIKAIDDVCTGAINDLYHRLVFSSLNQPMHQHWLSFVPSYDHSRFHGNEFALMNELSSMADYYTDSYCCSRYVAVGNDRAHDGHKYDQSQVGRDHETKNLIDFSKLKHGLFDFRVANPSESIASFMIRLEHHSSSQSPQPQPTSIVAPPQASTSPSQELVDYYCNIITRIMPSAIESNIIGCIKLTYDILKALGLMGSHRNLNQFYTFDHISKVICDYLPSCDQADVISTLTNLATTPCINPVTNPDQFNQFIWVALPNLIDKLVMQSRVGSYQTAASYMLEREVIDCYDVDLDWLLRYPMFASDDCSSIDQEINKTTQAQIKPTSLLNSIITSTPTYTSDAAYKLIHDISIEIPNQPTVRLDGKFIETYQSLVANPNTQSKTPSIMAIVPLVTLGCLTCTTSKLAITWNGFNSSSIITGILNTIKSLKLTQVTLIMRRDDTCPLPLCHTPSSTIRTHTNPDITNQVAVQSPQHARCLIIHASQPFQDQSSEMTSSKTSYISDLAALILDVGSIIGFKHMIAALVTQHPQFIRLYDAVDYINPSYIDDLVNVQLVKHLTRNMNINQALLLVNDYNITALPTSSLKSVVLEMLNIKSESCFLDLLQDLDDQEPLHQPQDWFAALTFKANVALATTNQAYTLEDIKQLEHLYDQHLTCIIRSLEYEPTAASSTSTHDQLVSSIRVNGKTYPNTWLSTVAPMRHGLLPQPNTHVLPFCISLQHRSDIKDLPHQCILEYTTLKPNVSLNIYVI